jgi:cell division protein FtsI (penicillin-binding protein 3)
MLERRLVCFAGIVSLWGGVVLYKLISLQIVHHQYYADKATSQQEATEDILAPRGAIFDRNGNPLALSEPKASIGVDPRRLDIAAASDLLSRVLHLDRAELASRMKWAYDHHKGYVSVKHRIADDEWQRLSLQPVNYWSVTQEGHRRYPNGPLLAHVLGSVDYEQKGNFGIEKYLDADLRGTPGKIRLLTDANKHGIESQSIADAVPGLPLTLTIDERIQYVAERELAAAAAAHQAPSGSVVVMNPYTGDILALASFPAFDPNQSPQPGEPAGLRMNHAVEAPFEPGSVFKVITLAAALETTNLTPDSMINCTATITLGGRTIGEAHPRGYGLIHMYDVLAKSSNVGAVRIGLQVGPENMYRYVRKFGFGQYTGIPLPSESRGLLHHIKTTDSVASVAFGHEVAVTTLQLAQAASVVANGGLLVRPRLILKKGDRTMPPPAPERVLKPDTAITMRKMMEGVVVLPEGTGKRARLVGYTSGGKTGSAVIFDYAAKRYTHSYNGSFMGFAPVTNPAIVVVVTLNGTHGDSGFGGAAAAPVFKEVASEALRVLEVPRDLPIEEPKPLLEKADNLDAPARDSAPRPITEDSEDAPAEAVAAPVAAPPPGPRVPNFRGMTMRDVINQAAAMGLTVLSDGSGVARKQDPPAGAPARPGDRVSVVFAR